MRKPEEGFYKHALDLLKVEPHEAVFLDDIGINLKAAQSLGIQTIRVTPESSLPAIRQLEKIVGMELISAEDAQAEEKRLQAKKKGSSKL
jgi:FMN phosphatase YigB (HAD superfamily)